MKRSDLILADVLCDRGGLKLLQLVLQFQNAKFKALDVWLISHEKTSRSVEEWHVRQDDGNTSHGRKPAEEAYDCLLADSMGGRVDRTPTHSVFGDKAGKCCELVR
jgi:hypothetical protein